MPKCLNSVSVVRLVKQATFCHSLEQAKQRFFIALLPPQEIQNHANQVKQLFAERYNSRGAQKSPPHITLQPPFEWSAEAVPYMEACLLKFANVREPVPITLSGYGAFVPRVIYINVLKTCELLTLQTDLRAYLETTLGIVDPVSAQRPFAPHMTVAFRDLTRQNFNAAWPEFQHQMLQFDFISTQLTLLIHNGQQWDVSTEFSFLA